MGGRDRVDVLPCILKRPGAHEGITKRCRAYGTQMNSPTLAQHSAYGCVLGPTMSRVRRSLSQRLYHTTKRSASFVAGSHAPGLFFLGVAAATNLVQIWQDSGYS